MGEKTLWRKDVSAKKSLGQNFLVDQEALQKVIIAADLSKSDNILEIGPGTGLLTEELIRWAGRVVAVEKDSKLARMIAEKFNFSILNPVFWQGGVQANRNSPILNFKNGGAVVAADILKINLPKLLEECDFKDYKVVANIPYYITGKILRLLLEIKYLPNLMVLMVQKEVAERICAKPGKMSILSLSVKLFGEPEIVGIVSRESFSPMPEVDSAILRIKPFSKSQFNLDKERIKVVLRLVKIGFSSRRKTLVNNLSSGLNFGKKKIVDQLSELGLGDQIRAQDLSVEQWIELSKKIFE